MLIQSWVLFEYKFIRIPFHFPLVILLPIKVPSEIPPFCFITPDRIPIHISCLLSSLSCDDVKSQRSLKCEITVDKFSHTYGCTARNKGTVLYPCQHRFPRSTTVSGIVQSSCHRGEMSIFVCVRQASTIDWSMQRSSGSSAERRVWVFNKRVVTNRDVGESFGDRSLIAIIAWQLRCCPT